MFANNLFYVNTFVFYISEPTSSIKNIKGKPNGQISSERKLKEEKNKNKTKEKLVSVIFFLWVFKNKLSDSVFYFEGQLNEIQRIFIPVWIN